MTTSIGNESGKRRTPAGPEQEPSLDGRLGTTALVLTVLGFLAPLSAAAGYIALVIGYGNGLGAPLTFLATGALFLVFSVGYTTLVRHVENPGAFYAYITAGLGKRVGLGAGFLSMAFYIMASTGFYAFGGIAAGTVMDEFFGIADVRWWVYVIGYLAIVTFLSYRGAELNAKVLGVIVALEVAVILVFNVTTLFRGGPDGRSTESFAWDAFTSGSLAVGTLFVITLYLGFESTAAYREEVRDPARTIPRATYIVVTVLAVFYAFTAWAIITATGTDSAVEKAAADPAGTFPAALEAMLGDTARDVAVVLIVTSVLASQLAIQNVTARYMYSLGIDGVLPAALGTAHPRYRSPFVAALVTSAITAVAVTVLVISGVDPAVAYGVFGGVVVYAFEILMLLVAIAVIVYFLRRPESGESRWRTLIAPGFSAVALFVLLVYSGRNSSLLVGEPTNLTTVLMIIIPVVAVFGFLYASWLASARPAVFQRIGRAEH